MKDRFTQGQIIGMIKEQESGITIPTNMSKTWHRSVHILPMERTIWRYAPQ